MKVYISLPITGLDIKEVKASAAEAKRKLKEMGHSPISPLDITPNEDMPYSYYMGADIMALLESEAVVFLPGWQNSNGCMLEFNAAIIYKKKIILHIDEAKLHRTDQQHIPE